MRLVACSTQFRRQVAFVISALAMLASCDRAEPEIVETVTRPGGDVDAVVALHSGGGAAGFVFWSIELVDSIAKERQGIAKISHGEKPRLSWKSADVLQLAVSCGDIREFTNVFHVRRAETFSTIEIALESGGPCKSS